MTQKNAVLAIGDFADVYGYTELQPKERIKVMPLVDEGFGLGISPDNQLVAFGHGDPPFLTVSRTDDWSAVSGTPAFGNWVTDCAFSVDGRFLAVTHYQSPYLTLIDTTTWSAISGTPSLPGIGRRCEFSGDGKTLAIAHDEAPYLTILDATTWGVIAGTPSFSREIHDIAYSPTSDRLATAGKARPHLVVLNTEDWTTVPDTPALPNWAFSCAYSPAGDVIAAGHYNYPFITFIDTASWTKITDTPAIGKEAKAVSFSPGGDQAAAVFESSPHIAIFDTQNWTLVSGLKALPHHGRACLFASLPVKSRKIKTQDHAGNDLTATVDVFQRNMVKEVEVQSAGTAEIAIFNSGDYWLIMPDDRDGATKDAFARITIDATSGDLPPLVLTQGYIGDLVSISSNLTTQAGAPGDEVVIRNWTTRELVAKVVPDASGDWSAEVPPGTYDVSYIAENCAPVIHGPYTVELP